METCTYDLDHSAVAATHYYKAYEGDRVNLCFDCASRFGYPQYLVEYPVARPWRPEAAYLVNIHDGSGQGSEVADVWPETETETVAWLSNLPRQEADWLLADAIYAAYDAHFAEYGDWTYEVRKVTCLPVV